ncbi:MAG: TolC family protein, partial [Candidatus Zixiibacteriota bacterium]
IQMARNNARIAANNKGQGLAGFLPTLDASGGYAVVDRDQETDLPPADVASDLDNWSAELSLSWTLFDGFSMFANRSRYNELAKKGEFEARDQIETAVVDITNAYFNLVQQQQLLQAARELRDVSETRYKREKVRHDIGGATSTDLLNAQVSFNSDQTLLLNQELQVIIARKQLNILLGQDPSTEFTVVEEIPLENINLEYDAILKRALDYNSGLKATELDRSISRRQIQLARASFLPRLSFFTSYEYTDQTTNSDAGSYPNQDIGTKTGSTTFGLNLTFNLFNGTRDKIDLQNAKIEANNQELALRDARNRLVGQVKEAYDTYLKRIEIVAMEEQNIVAARQNLSLQQDKFRVGSATSLEFRDAQVSLNNAQSSLIKARYQARLAKLQLEQLMGALEVY